VISLIATTSTYTAGDFTVQQRPRQDNPAFAVFLVFLGETLIGKQFSRPTESDCRWLERNIYAAPNSARYADTSGRVRRLRGVTAVGPQRCLTCGAPSGLSSTCQKHRRR
jgi:hypothetical protein